MGMTLGTHGGAGSASSVARVPSTPRFLRPHMGVGLSSGQVGVARVLGRVRVWGVRCSRGVTGGFWACRVLFQPHMRGLGTS